jgi:hypothetical protein
MTTTDRAAIVLQQIDARIAAIAGNWPDESRALRCLKTAIEGMLEQQRSTEEFRDAVLNQRWQLESPMLDNDQTNAVLGLFDDRVTDAAAALTTICDQWEAAQ